MANFTLLDLFASSLAFILFSLIFVIPGYVTCWTLNLFEFKSRRGTTQFVIAIVISTSISPIITFITWNSISVDATFLAFLAFAISFLVILVKTKRILTLTKLERPQKLAIYAGAGWVALAILTLVDIQWGNRLYFNVVSYDFTTRAAIINAITRTGVPPINPGFFPGHPVRLTYLYYFWYIPCSLVDQLGGSWVDGRTAMIASVAWCGLALMATVALYLRLRNPHQGAEAYRSGLLGSSLLLISGVDAFPALSLIVITRLHYGFSFLNGDIEQWNEQLTAWVGALSWVPHHVAAMIACLAGMMLVHSIRNKAASHRFRAMFIAGLAFASAFGLSVYVTIVFALFWGIWMIVSFLQEERQLSMFMAMAGIIAIIAVAPFIAELWNGGSSSSSGFPIAFAVRTFRPIIPIISSLRPVLINLVLLALLPINYAMELGFFFVVGAFWLQQHYRSWWQENPFHVAEMILLLVVLFIGSFIRSTAIGSNDLGWRAWLPGQFVLIIWGVDILREFSSLGRKTNLRQPNARRTTIQLFILLAFGLFTTTTDLALLRIWPVLVDWNIAGFPNDLSPDTNLGRRTYDARLAYEFINSSSMEGTIIQNNPQTVLDRPSGLYANRQMVISDRTAYGVPQRIFEELKKDVGTIFEVDRTWVEVDAICDRYSINLIVVNDLDPLWKQLPGLEKTRSPLYKNQYYSIFSCSDSPKRP